MNVRIYYRSTTTWNIILHIFMSFMFLYLSKAVLVSKSIFEKEFLTSVVQTNIPLIVLYLVSIISIYRLSTKSKPLFILSILITLLNIGYILLLDFSKLIILILFLYIIVSYYLYNFLKTQLDQSYYNPNYQEDDLFTPMLKHFKCKIKSNDTELEGYLTNWSESGFFVYLDANEKKLKSKNFKQTKITILFNDYEFNCDVNLVCLTRDSKAVGFKIKDRKEEEDLSWFSFYQIIDKMGYQVELLK